MTERQKIAHLLRRLGLGASKRELDLLEPHGVQGTVRYLLEFEDTDEQFDISPWEFCFEPDNPSVLLDPGRFASWWALRLLFTRRPFQEKLAVFWHDHFAVNGEKVEFGPSMLRYLDAIRRLGPGKFEDLLIAMSREPAMLRYLDGDRSSYMDPNENFAREVLELFTMGIGNYTEEDINELARVFTGYTLRHPPLEPDYQEWEKRMRAAVEHQTPMIVYAFSPEMHDAGEKTVLGRKEAFTPESVLQFLAGHPSTAKYITQKLWNYFACDELPQDVHQRLIARYDKTDGNITEVVRQIVAEDFFWSDKCVRHRVKSPVDFIVPILRQMNLDPFLRMARKKPETHMTPVDKPLRDTAWFVLFTMQQQGMFLMFPPDVAGWNWGNSWISPDSMSRRAQFAPTIFYLGDGEYPITKLVLSVIQAREAKTEEAIVDVLADLVDADFPAEKKALLVEACKRAGGVGAMEKPESAAWVFTSVGRMMFAAPEFQVC